MRATPLGPARNMPLTGQHNWCQMAKVIVVKQNHPPDGLSIFRKQSIRRVVNQTPALFKIAAHGLSHGLVLVGNHAGIVIAFCHGFRVQLELFTYLPKTGLWGIADDVLMNFHDAQQL
jgi:hypothetical protein